MLPELKSNHLTDLLTKHIDKVIGGVISSE